jgi:signal peptidase II
LVLLSRLGFAARAGSVVAARFFVTTCYRGWFLGRCRGLLPNAAMSRDALFRQKKSCVHSFDPAHKPGNVAMPHRATRAVLLIGVLLSCVGCDQVTKQIAVRQLKYAEPTSYLGDVLRIQYAENPGGFLSLAGNLSPTARRWILTIPSAVFLVVLVVVLLARWNMPADRFVACGLILAGGVGNLIDRVTQGGIVIDFLNMGIGPLRTGIFNVADVVLMAGAALLLIGQWRRDRANSRDAATAAEAS